MANHKTYYIRDETSRQLAFLATHYKRSNSHIIKELIEQRFNAINRHKKPKQDSVEAKEKENGTTENKENR